MKIKVKEGSSIWQLATVWGNESLPSDFCALTRIVVFVFFIISCFICMFSMWMGHVLAAIMASIMTSSLILVAPLIAFLGCVLIIAAFFGIFVAAVYFRNNPSTVLNNVGLVYDGWKEKYCPLVEKIDK